MSAVFADTFRLPFPESTFGNRFGVHDIVDGHDLYGPQGHRGTDFKVPMNTTVPAIANGEVVHVLWSNAIGNVVVLRHYLHGPGNDVYSGYCHLASTTAKVGQQIKAGGMVGHSGMTGTAATGPHLHLTMSHSDMGVEYGEVFDPIEFIEKNARVATPQQVIPSQGKAAPAKPVFTAARRGEGLIMIAARSHITLEQIEALNPDITPPNFLVLLGQQVRIR